MHYSVELIKVFMTILFIMYLNSEVVVLQVNFVILVIVIRATLRSYAMAKKSTVERSK